MNATTGRSVIVVGAGMARLVAALQAQQLGGQVTLLEKGNAPGGSLALSGGTLRCARAMQICAASCHVVIDLRGSRCISAGSQNGVRRIKWCVRIWHCSWRGAWVRLVGFITEPATVRQILAHAGEPTTALVPRNRATLVSRPRAGQRPGAVDFAGHLRALWCSVETSALDHRRTDGLPSTSTSAGAYVKHSPTVHIVYPSDPHSSRDNRCQN